MIDLPHGLPINRQAKRVGMARSSAYYQSQPISEADLALMRRIGKLHPEHPFAGAHMRVRRCAEKTSGSTMTSRIAICCRTSAACLVHQMDVAILALSK
ncbi:hypothetical protein HNQ59_003780 [Chitinivorax tropicus]|uniref:Uncharacterized protein n=1 Tax=Chitinivorax tropicus TaxID=714531 RepID=A0A840MPT7_9PROT|nr:hypothetical protein [Chitinivorax tropicus]MBB5020460.1 hypothetical protein [Chitinivorax tropicus]